MKDLLLWLIFISLVFYDGLSSCIWIQAYARYDYTRSLSCMLTGQCMLVVEDGWSLDGASVVSWDCTCIRIFTCWVLVKSSYISYWLKLLKISILKTPKDRWSLGGASVISWDPILHASVISWDLTCFCMVGFWLVYMGLWSLGHAEQVTTKCVTFFFSKKDMASLIFIYQSS